MIPNKNPCTLKQSVFMQFFSIFFTFLNFIPHLYIENVYLLQYNNNRLFNNIINNETATVLIKILRLILNLNLT